MAERRSLHAMRLPDLSVKSPLFDLCHRFLRARVRNMSENRGVAMDGAGRNRRAQPAQPGAWR